ncbi:hypothetical protein F0562_001227 [Nyssa sinensis]|uniref:Nuclear transcription factor Y subunit n=1 Tax=Nyssa sinensis TaxID=561372 RepID=A0A5J5C349_9ASTE|nr:hypothetical protein F0562_001227 [Nyssa sinensis]
MDGNGHSNGNCKKESGSTQSKSERANHSEYPYNISPSTVCFEPWWRSAGYNAISPAVIGGNASNSSSMEQSKDGQSESDGGLNEEDDDANKESQNAASTRSDGNYGQEHQNFRHFASTIPRSGENLTQPPQFELVGHSIACGSNPYSDPYYGGMVAAYGPQPLVNPHLLDVHHARMALPLEMAQEPVYVNAKQYRGILRRRQSRAKAELEKKLIKVRKPYIHESRHQHAVRRPRASGGRFAKKSEADASKCMEEEKGKSIGLSQPASSSGSEPLPSDSTETLNGNQESRGPKVQETSEARVHVNEINQYHNYSSFQASTYQSQLADKGKEKDFKPEMG